MINFDRFELSNGLKVIVHQDKSTPIVAMNIIYKVGSRDESVRRTGFAHLFEHLMFGGSKNIPKFDIPLEEAGGENNAFTNSDYTNYYLTIPKNNLEIAFWLEADRMFDLSFSDKSLDVQRQVVIEEFKQNYLNQPLGDVYLLLKPLAYKKHPYRWNTIGKDIHHIESATMKHVRSFYKKYYNPNNAILSIAGDVEISDIKKLAKKWFEPIPSGINIERNYPKEPEQMARRKKSVKRNIPLDALYMAWHMPNRTDIGFYHCDLISDILSNGNSSRLYRKLVKDKGMFSEINAFVTGDLDEGLFIVSGKVLNHITMTKAIAAIESELDLISTEIVDLIEFEKVKNKLEANMIYSSSSVLTKAMNLGFYELLGDANKWNNELEIYRSISREEMRDTAKRIFQKKNQNILIYNKQS
jgi:predicted Zn-dependent peptidase